MEQLRVLVLCLLVGCAAPAEEAPPPVTPAPAASPTPAAAPPAPTPAATAAPALALGGTFPAWSAPIRGGGTLRLPDPTAGVVILELIRSADW